MIWTIVIPVEFPDYDSAKKYVDNAFFGYGASTNSVVHLI